MNSIQKEREAFEAVPEIKQWVNALRYGEKTGVYIAIDNDKHEGVASWVNGAWWIWQAKAQEVQQWISVQDRMPEQGQKVLVFRPDAHNHPHKDPNFKICTYAGADIFINSHFEHVITHWKPLESPIEAQEPAND